MMNPLPTVDRLEPHSGRVLDLPRVTMITFDDRTGCDISESIASITRWHRRFLRPAREVVVSGLRPAIEGIEWVRSVRAVGDPIKSYSRWCQMELRGFFDTSHVLIWQTDGFALDPEAWTDEFLEYDFVGSPFFWVHPLTAGNGGFCLRSKLFCESASRQPDGGGAPEDVYLTLSRRGELERDGVKFAPGYLANRWGADYRGDVSGKFGFHGRTMLPCALRQIARMWRPDGSNVLLPSGNLMWNGASLKKKGACDGS